MESIQIMKSKMKLQKKQKFQIKYNNKPYIKQSKTHFRFNLLNMFLYLN